MIVVGTAGHIDHGKSAIVKRLTGTDPDRLPEEQARGMTIDLGFAFYKTNDGGSVALVDVPGHERFVKNMIAGAGGIDVVMLVIAADDGWMPQSQEHFQVVRLLGVKEGLIVINKTDLADPEWLDLLEQDIRDKVAGSFLEKSPIFKVSAQTGDGFDALRDYLDQLPKTIESRTDYGKPRLYIDRSFVRTGIGGVVTGTLRGGALSVGDSITLWPSLKAGKIRSLQSNNIDVQTAQPGQRTAVSITGVDKEFLVRGGVISKNLNLEYLSEHQVMALDIKVLEEALVPLKDRRRLLLIAGTTELTGEIRLFDRKEIAPGEGGIVFFRSDQPLLSLIGDHFIVRLPSPMVTVGGGQVLAHYQKFPRRKTLDRFSYLNNRLTSILDDLVVSELKRLIVASSDNFLECADYPADEINSAISRLREKKLIKVVGRCLVHTETVVAASAALKSVAESYLADKPHLKGLSLEEITKLSPLESNATKSLLEYLVTTSEMAKLGDRFDVAGRVQSLKGVIKQAYDEIMTELKSDPFKPPSLSSLAARGKNYKQAISYIIDTGGGYKCGSDFIFEANAWRDIIAFIHDTLKTNGELTVATLRDKFDFSRKFVIPILEETDRIKITRRDGDKRVQGDSFEG